MSSSVLLHHFAPGGLGYILSIILFIFAISLRLAYLGYTRAANPAGEKSGTTDVPGELKFWLAAASCFPVALHLVAAKAELSLERSMARNA